MPFSHKLKVRKISQKNGREQMKCNEVENVFKADACVELEADVPADRAISRESHRPRC